MPEISVIIPVYNVEQYLKKCVDSVLEQSFKNIEVILVDDGSPDKCPEICDCYAKQDDRVIVVHKENGGLSSARNAGLKIARGRYIYFVDSDDWIVGNALEILLTIMQNTKSDVVIASYDLFFDETKTIEELPIKIKDEVISGRDVVDKLTGGQGASYVIACNKLYKRELFQTISFREGYIHEDCIIAHRIFGQCNSVACTSQAVYFYRRRTNSIMGMGRNIQRTDALTAYADYILYTYENGWNNMTEKMSEMYAKAFFELVSLFTFDKKDVKYRRRVSKSLKDVLCFLLANKQIQLSHKVRFIVFSINPWIYRFWDKFVLEKIKFKS